MPRIKRKNIASYTDNELVDFINLYNDCVSVKELQKRSKESTDQIDYLMWKLIDCGLIEPIRDDRQKRKPVDWLEFIEVYCTKNTLMEVSLELGVDYKEIKRRINLANSYNLDLPMWEVGFTEKVENERRYFPSPHSGNPQDMARKLRGGRYDDCRGQNFQTMNKLTIYKAQRFIAQNKARWEATRNKLAQAMRGAK